MSESKARKKRISDRCYELMSEMNQDQLLNLAIKGTGVDRQAARTAVRLLSDQSSVRDIW